VGAPADDYVADFVRDVPKSHVLTLRWVMRPAGPDDELDGARFAPGTIIREALHAAAASEKPICVADGEALLGVVDRANILEVMAGQPDAAPGQ
jgi:glycine betaine/proline transport system ATP-binding protein